jgi:hypothetical protein
VRQAPARRAAEPTHHLQSVVVEIAQRKPQQRGKGRGQVVERLHSGAVQQVGQEREASNQHHETGINGRWGWGGEGRGGDVAGTSRPRRDWQLRGLACPWPLYSGEGGEGFEEGSRRVGTLSRASRTHIHTHAHKYTHAHTHGAHGSGTALTPQGTPAGQVQHGTASAKECSSSWRWTGT